MLGFITGLLRMGFKKDKTVVGYELFFGTDTLTLTFRKESSSILAILREKNNILTTVLEGKLEGKRPRGQPRNNWMADIKEWTCQSA